MRRGNLFNNPYRGFILQALNAQGKTTMDYVAAQVKAGHSREQILERCVDQGFLDEEVDAAFISLRTIKQGDRL